MFFKLHSATLYEDAQHVLILHYNISLFSFLTWPAELALGEGGGLAGASLFQPISAALLGMIEMG